MAQLKVRPKVDVAFKKLFADNENYLKRFISLALKLENVETFNLKMSEVTPIEAGGKFCRLDIRAEINGREIDVEIQLTDRADFRERALYYGSLLLSKNLKSGEMNYSKIPPVAVISIVNFKLFPMSDYYSYFGLFDQKHKELLTDKLEFHFFELNKTPPIDKAKSEVEYWLKLIDAETEEDIQKLEKMLEENPIEEISGAIVEVRRMNKDEKFIQEVEARENTLREEQSALNSAKDLGERIGEARGIEIGKIAVARKLLKRNISVEDIAEDTGLSISEIEKLKTEV